MADNTVEKALLELVQATEEMKTWGQGHFRGDPTFPCSGPWPQAGLIKEECGKLRAVLKKHEVVIQRLIAESAAKTEHSLVLEALLNRLISINETWLLETAGESGKPPNESYYASGTSARANLQWRIRSAQLTSLEVMHHTLHQADSGITQSPVFSNVREYIGKATDEAAKWAPPSPTAGTDLFIQRTLANIQRRIQQLDKLAEDLPK